jgi:hypothetical protein
MQALFIGQTYIDVTSSPTTCPLATRSTSPPTTRVVRRQCGHRGLLLRQARHRADLIATVANDWLGRMFQDMATKYGISIHPRKVKTSSLSFIMPKDGKRAIVRCRRRRHIHPFRSSISRMPRAACRRPPAGCRDPLRQTCREAGI